MLKEFTTHSEAETATIATALAAELTGNDILFLEGDLGAGKSVFARALIRILSENPDLTVPSPTFTLLQTYDTSKGTVWHYDLYRLKDPDEMEELSWDDAMSGGIVLIEWPERLGAVKPDGITISIETVPGAETSRVIRIERP